MRWISRRLLFPVAVLVVATLVTSVGAATPARAANDFTLTLSAADLGVDPARVREIVPQLQAEIAQDGGLSASIKKDIRENPLSGQTVDVESMPDFGGTLTRLHLGHRGARVRR